MTAYLKAVDTAKPRDTDRTAYIRVPQEDGDPKWYLLMPEGDRYTGAAAGVLAAQVVENAGTVDRIERGEFFDAVGDDEDAGEE